MNLSGKSICSGNSVQDKAFGPVRCTILVTNVGISTLALMSAGMPLYGKISVDLPRNRF